MRPLTTTTNWRAGQRRHPDARDLKKHDLEWAVQYLPA